MPKPVTVWAVELEKEESLEEIKGTLRLSEGALVFTPRDEGGPPSRIPLAEVARVRRLRGSPVLMVFHSSPDGERRTAFYFAQPPPLGPYIGDTVERPSGLAGFRNPKRKARRDNVGYLGVMNREKKAMLTEWVRAVRAAMTTGSRGPSRPAEG